MTKKVIAYAKGVWERYVIPRRSSCLRVITIRAFDGVFSDIMSTSVLMPINVYWKAALVLRQREDDSIQLF
jgi:hypothetical protein